MNRNQKTSCDVCGRGTNPHYAYNIPARRLDEPNSYTICNRADCNTLAKHIKWWFQDNEDVDWYTFEEIIETIDDPLRAKEKFTPTWERVDCHPSGTPTYLTDFTEVDN